VKILYFIIKNDFKNKNAADKSKNLRLFDIQCKTNILETRVLRPFSYCIFLLTFMWISYTHWGKVACP
jgi:hypothetical protein